MRSARRTVVITSALAALSLLGGQLSGRRALAAPNLPGFVYVMTNQASANAIAMFSRAESGTLTPLGTFPTGGLGNGTAPDSLRSQGGLVLSGQFLFAVNAGSHDVSSLRIQGNQLVFVSRISSGGVRPTSLTVGRNGALIYVVNAGSGTISGLRVNQNGVLSALPHSTKPLSGGQSADPSQISFAGNRLLLVSTKQPSVFDAYIVNSNGLAEGPFTSPSNGQTPFGFDFDAAGHVIVSEAFGGAPGAGAVSSYSILEDASLGVISGSVPNGQTSSCWLVTTNNGAFAYVSNTDSSSISSYQVLSGGSLALFKPTAGATTPGGKPVDLALDAAGRLLYAVVNSTGTISGFRVRADGTLVKIPDTGGLPPFAQGIAAQ